VIGRENPIFHSVFSHIAPLIARISFPRITWGSVPALPPLPEHYAAVSTTIVQH